MPYTERLAEAGIEPSVGSVGDSYDNALAETINGLFKAQVIHRRGPERPRQTFFTSPEHEHHCMNQPWLRTRDWPVSAVFGKPTK